MALVKYPFLIPDLPDPALWINKYRKSYDAGQFSNFGPLSTELENQMTERYCSPGYSAVACSSATSGLAVALLSKFQPGQTIAVSNFTFAATYQAIRMARLEPILIDIDPETLEISIASLDQACQTTSIDGVVAVRPYGIIGDNTQLHSYCSSAGLPVVVDGAAGLGGSRFPKIGSHHEEIEVVSLHATKTFGIGEGGIIFCPTPLVPSIRSRLNFGILPNRRYQSGINGKMDELHAAVGLAQLSRIGDLQRFREKVAKRYFELFSLLDGIQLPTLVPQGTAWNMFPVVFRDILAENVITVAAKHGIETRRYYWPTISEGATEDVAQPVSLRNSEEISRAVVCFPVYTAKAGDLLKGLFQTMENDLLPALYNK